MASITAATAIFYLSIPGVFPTPQQLQGFATDDIFSMDPVETVEVMMGVDGHLSGGFVFKERKQSVTLQADSNSNAVFDGWQEASELAKDAYIASGIVILKSVGTKWALTNGFLTSYASIPDAGKVLKARKFGITWESVSRAAA